MPRQSDPGAAFAVFPAELEPVAAARPIGYINASAPVAQLDRALPSEGKGHTFESCRVRHFPYKPRTFWSPAAALSGCPVASAGGSYDLECRSRFLGFRQHASDPLWAELRTRHYR